MRVPRLSVGNNDYRSRLPLLAGNIGWYLASLQLAIHCPLDFRNVRALGTRGKGRRFSGRPGPSCAANAVNEILRDLRKIVIHYVRDRIDVNAGISDLLKRVNRDVNTAIAPTVKSYGTDLRDGWAVACIAS